MLAARVLVNDTIEEQPDMSKHWIFWIAAAALVTGCGSDNDGSNQTALTGTGVTSYSYATSTTGTSSSGSAPATTSTSLNDSETSATTSTSSNATSTVSETGITSTSQAGSNVVLPVPSPLPQVIAALPAAFPGVFFDDFFSDNGGQPSQNFNDFIQWTVTDGTVDFVGGNVLGAQGGRPFGRFVGLGGSTGNPGRFATRVPILFAPGVSYTLSFAFLSTDSRPHTAQATLGNKVFTVTTSDPNQYSSYSSNFTFDNATSAPLVFQDLGDGNGGIGVDFIFVRPTTL